MSQRRFSRGCAATGPVRTIDCLRLLFGWGGSLLRLAERGNPHWLIRSRGMGGGFGRSRLAR